MKRLLPILAFVLMFALVASAGWNHVYVARDADDSYVTKKRTKKTDLPLQHMRQVSLDDDSTTNILCYIVYVTEAEFDADWASVPQAKKDAAKDAAQDWSEDYEDWDTRNQAVIDALFLEINMLRTNAGFSAYNNGQIKQKIKDKKKKPKDK